MGCVLRTAGKLFDIDAFLRESEMEPLVVWRTGEPRATAADPMGKRHDDSGMNVSVSERDFSDLSGQIDDAIMFLRTYRDELARLRKFAGNEGIQLDFPIQDRNVAVQQDIFPPELLSLLGDLGIVLAISRYPSPTDDLSS